MYVLCHLRYSYMPSVFGSSFHGHVHISVRNGQMMCLFSSLSREHVHTNPCFHTHLPILPHACPHSYPHTGPHKCPHTCPHTCLYTPAMQRTKHTIQKWPYPHIRERIFRQMSIHMCMRISAHMFTHISTHMSTHICVQMPPSASL